MAPPKQKLPVSDKPAYGQRMGLQSAVLDPLPTSVTKLQNALEDIVYDHGIQFCLCGVTPYVSVIRSDPSMKYILTHLRYRNNDQDKLHGGCQVEKCLLQLK
mgnify:CR=1 FL=1